MRLTLRTLLAYLDRTLDPADQTALGEKVQASSIASTLAKRIRQVMSSPTIEAPSADAVGPTDDANAIAEYLDDTLAPELTADVERQCVGSDGQLAEVAACHQVLAIVLGEPAEVPASLRKRVYGLKSSEMAANGEGTVVAAEATAGPPVSEGAKTQITPVGPNDSGVAEATTRLAAEPDLNATLAAATKVIRKNHTNRDRQASGPAMAGERSRETLEAIGPLLSGGRPSRVTPYLVTLALMAAFLFVVYKAFDPILNKRRTVVDSNVSEVDPAATDQDGETSLIPADPAPTPTSPQPAGDSPASASGSGAPASGSGASASGSGASASGSGASASGNDTSSSGSSDADQPASRDEIDVATAVPSVQPSPAAPPKFDSERPAVGEAAKPNEATSANPQSPAPPQSPSPAPGVAGSSAGGSPQRPINPLDAAEQTPLASPSIGVVESTGGLLMKQDANSGQWEAVDAEASIVSGEVLACGPSYRARLLLDRGLELSLVGPCAIRVDKFSSEVSGQPGLMMLTVDFGRAVMMATTEPLELYVATPAASGRCRLTGPGAVAAMAVAFQRPPGADPLQPGAARPVADLISVQDRIDWIARATPTVPAPSPLTLNTGQLCRLSPSVTPQIVPIQQPPSWTSAQSLPPNSPAAMAQQGLAEFLQGDQPLEVALREAIGFRHQEVSGLAARILLNLGMVDVFFGPQGVFNRPEQRNEWPVLVGDLRAFIDRGPGAAGLVGAAVGQLENEAAGKIWGLLVGFSPEQLERGADATLIELMDDPSMTVRVIATETLREITGDTLAYRPDYETAARRSKIHKELQRLFRRDQVRWSDPQVGQQGVPRIDGNDRPVATPAPAG